MGFQYLKRIGSLLLIGLLFFNIVNAKIEVSSTVNRRNINKDEVFRLAVTVELIDEDKDFEGENIKFPDVKNLEIENRYISSSRSVSIVNFDKTEKKVYKIVYQLMYTGDKNKIEIPPIQIKIGKNHHITKSITLNVGRSSSGSSNDSGSKDLFIKAVINKDDVYKYEKISADYYLYIKENIQLHDLASHSKNNFDKYLSKKRFNIFDKLNKRENINFETKIINGIRYNRIKLYSYDFAPEKVGMINLPELSFKVAIRKRRKRHGSGNDFFDSFMSSSTLHKEIVRTVPRKIKVKDLPALTYDYFSNIVCEGLEISSSISKNKAKTNEGLTYTIKFKGNFFQDIVNDPEFKNMDNWEIYDPEIKSDNNFVEYKYLIVPQRVGDLTVPTKNIVYFDSNEKKYKKIELDSIQIQVEAGDSYYSSNSEKSGNGKRKFKTANLHYIKDTDIVLKEYNLFIKSWWYILLIIFSVLLILIRVIKDYRTKKYLTDGEFRRKIKSSKMAKKWKKDIKKVEDKHFYSYALNFLQNYFSNKLNLKGNLPTRDELIQNIEGIILKNKSIKNELIEKIRNIYDELEKGKFSPTEAKSKNDIAGDIEEIIDEFERKL